jgi:hypothetical protein
MKGESLTIVIDKEVTRITAVEGVGIDVEIGELEQGVFVPTRSKDQILFADRPDLAGIWECGSWSWEVVTNFLFDKPEAQPFYGEDERHDFTEEDYQRFIQQYHDKSQNGQL